MLQGRYRTFQVVLPKERGSRSAFGLRHGILLLLAIALGLLAAFAFTITPVSAQDSDDYDPTFVPEGELPIGSIAPTKDADELPVMKRPADIPDDWLNIVPGEPLPDSMKDQRDPSLRAPAPASISVTAYDDDSISLEWKETTDTSPVIAYLVEFKKGTGSWLTQQTVFNRTTATASGLECETSYSFRVRAAAFPMGYGGPSGTATQSTTLCTVEAPSNFTRTSNTCNRASFSWSASDGAVVYRIDRLDGTVWRIAGYVTAPATTDTVSIPEGGMSEFRISARGNGIDYSRAYGDASDSVTVTTDFCTRKVGYASSTYTATEGGSATTVHVNFSPSLLQARSIPITASGSGSYTLGGLTNGNLVAAQGNQSKTFTITAKQDDNCVNETITLGFTRPSDMAYGTNRSTQVTLADDHCNVPPDFGAPDPRPRTVLENRASGTNVGAPVTATDPDGDTIEYSLSGSSRFRINTSTGQITTTESLDREEQSSYSVTVTATDEHDATGTVGVDITVGNVDEAPYFPIGETGRRSVDENTPSGRNIGSPVSAMDDDGFPLTYSLGGTDASSFSIVSSTGQLRTSGSLNVEVRVTCNVTVTATDATGLTASKDIVITLRDIQERPYFPASETGQRSVPENTESGENIGAPVEAMDDDGLPLTYSISGADASTFSVVSTTGQLQTRADLDHEDDSTYTFTMTVRDRTLLTETQTVTITVTDQPEPPRFPAGETGQRSVPENVNRGTNVGDPVTAVDDDEGLIRYSLSGDDAAAFSIVSTTGQIRTRADLDHEVKSTYTFTITVRDATNLSDTQSVTVTVTDVEEAPEFPGTESGSRTVPENTPAGTDIGSPVAATDDDDDTITYTLGGTDAASFGIVSSTGQLQTKADLDHEAKPSYSVSVTATDSTRRAASKAVLISVSDAAECPAVPDRPGVSPPNATVTNELRVTWDEPSNTGPPVTGYSVQYKAATAPTFSVVNTPDLELTLVGLKEGTEYTVRVRAMNDECSIGPYSEPGAGTTNALPPPVITLVRDSNTPTIIDEGDTARWSITASRSTTTDLTIGLTVSESPTGAWLSSAAPTSRTLRAGQTSVALTLRTDDDSVDEPNGNIQIRIDSGSGYSVGSPSTDGVLIRDDDPAPAIPTGLRANGDMDSDDGVTVRWDRVTDATKYRLRYTVESCTPAGTCTPDDSNWQTTDDIKASGNAVEETELDGLSEGVAYRVEVRSGRAEFSDWSENEFAIVYPTDDPISDTTEVVTAPLHGYQAENSQGSHEFHYVVCGETITSDVTTSLTYPHLNRTKGAIITDIQNAVDRWEDGIIWNEGTANIISTLAYTLPHGEDCSDKWVPSEDGRFEVKFWPDNKIKEACAPHRRLADILTFDLVGLGGDGPPACWRSDSWLSYGIDEIESGSILINTRVGVVWNQLDTSINCTYLHRMVAHEVGHAFGIGNAIGIDLNRHPKNTTHSIMSYDDQNDYCRPQAYDIAAIMALYQSR